ncbi:MAG: hypothetical protein GY791_14845 [Alphaproteobacteria bacterium]|nr:hypothetical protein [Alphaproteobacteria bacterium]
MLEMERTVYRGIAVAAVLMMATIVIAIPNRDDAVKSIKMHTSIPTQQMSKSL